MHNNLKNTRIFHNSHLSKILILSVGLTAILMVANCSLFHKYKIKKVEYTFETLKYNDLGDPAKRTFYIVLPPGYNKSENADKHYPTVYLLHGIGGTNETVKRFAKIARAKSEVLFNLAKIKEMILVIPHAGTSLCGNPDKLECGSFYRNSPITGNYKDYILDELVDVVDSKFRTLQSRSKRGISGFSMGGFGTMMLAMESNVESAAQGKEGRFGSAASHSGLLSLEIYLQLLTKPPDYMNEYIDTHLIPALTAAFSPYQDLELQYNEGTGEITKNEDVWQLWLNNDPLTYLSIHAENAYKDLAIYIDCGETDELGVQDHALAFHEKLDELGKDHEYEIYKYEVIDIDEINDLLSGHLFIEWRVSKSLQFHSKLFYP